MKRHYLLLQAPEVAKESGIKPIRLLETSDPIAGKAVEEFIDKGYTVVGNLSSDMPARILLSGINALTEARLRKERIKLNKINEYIFMLAESGTLLPANIAKHLDGEIWELRPIRDRILFAGVFGDSFVLLHSFVKKTQKTPKREIEQAKRELDDFIDRNSEGE